MEFILPLINLGVDIGRAIRFGLFWIVALIDGLIYNLVAYSFKIFQLMCTVNFNSLYGILQPLVDRLQAVLIVFIVYLLAVYFIEHMLNPDKAVEGGKKLLMNLLIGTALFVSYNFIFSVFNELNIVLMGNEFGYKYTTLGEVFDIADEDTKDEGVIMRFIFGNQDVSDPGKTIAVSIASIFIREKNSESSPVQEAVCNSDKCDFNRLRKTAISRGGTTQSIPDHAADDNIDYTPIFGFIVCIFVIYSMFSGAIQVGIRMFKLIILQMVFPIVIVDIIKNGFKGKFEKWAKTYIGVFLEAIIRMLSILIITVFVSKFLIHINDYFPGLQNEKDFITKFIIMIIIVIAAYLFAGKIPSFLEEAIGIKVGGDGKGGFGSFIGGLVGGVAGGVMGLAAGAGTGTLTGAVSGLVGGVAAGTKGKNVADFFKGQAENSARAKNVGANTRMVGGAGKYVGSKIGEFFGRPQSHIEKGKLAGERQTAMDNMIKNLEDYYEYDMKVTDNEGHAMKDAEGNDITVGLDRDKFREYAYDIGNENGFYEELSSDTQYAVIDTRDAEKEFERAQAAYQEAYTRGDSDRATLQKLNSDMEAAKSKYQILKSSTDKKIDTDFNTKMLRDTQNGNHVKAKGKNAVEQSKRTYNNVASKGHSTKDMIGGKSNTKKASEEYTKQQDIHNNSGSVTRYNNRNTRS